ncbi:MAG: nucleoside hydrolase [Oscillospiraceae bacterium]|nr:nucleoside hydrolase [Oscillospiraceae bacterium]
MSLRPLIIDTDPGGDDAQAIMLLAASGMFNIRAICAVHGNVGLEYTRRNALYLRDTAGLTCPVCQGASEALLARQPRAAYAHGNNGLSGLEFEVNEDKLSRKHPWDVIYDEALHWGGELEIFAIGPLTNIAIALLRHPDLPNYIKQVTIMGGAATKGNSGAYGEFNIVQDPHALKVCLSAGFKKFVMVDLDSCRTAFLTDEEAEYLDNLPLSNPWKPLYDKFAMAQRERRLLMSDEQRRKMGFPKGRGGCDAAAAFVLSHPESCVLEDYFCLCETRSALNFGQTIFDWKGRFREKPNVTLTRSIDRDAYAAWYLEMLHSYDGGIEA